MSDKSKSSILVKNFKIDSSQEELLAELCETIIPKTDTPGAKDISAHLFVLKMIDDCRSKDDQQRFVAGLKAFEKAAAETMKPSFQKASQDQRNKLVASLEANKEENELTGFYRSVKRLTVQAYTSSQFYMTRVKVYELVPGRWNGCVPIQAKNKLS
jgi:hypothetical protein